MLNAALSTMWGIGQFDTLAVFFERATALGFARFELNHAVDSRMLRDTNGYRIASVHEPCPADVSVRELKARDWMVSSLDEDNRRQGVAAIQRSIDLAVTLGASVVIVHPGRIDLDTAVDDRMRRLYREGAAGSDEFASAREEYISARAARADANMSAVRRSLVELAEYAGARNITLGLENRYHYFEVPTPDELAQLLELGFPNVGFWYDVGHAETLERLGFYGHADWLDRFAPSIVGAHLHDVIGIDDHQFAGSGQVDWDRVSRSLPAAALRTCEFQSFNTAEQVAAGVRWLEQKGCLG